jgi:hypothetical protein
MCKAGSVDEALETSSVLQKKADALVSISEETQKPCIYHWLNESLDRLAQVCSHIQRSYGMLEVASEAMCNILPYNPFHVLANLYYMGACHMLRRDEK